MADGDRRIGQEGSRWYNALPTGEELATWFKDNVKILDGLSGDDYVQGITLIPNTEKQKAVVGWDQNDFPVIEQRENLVFTPYAKVETRIKYWNDWLTLEANKHLLGVVEPNAPENQPKGLPPGFFPFSIARDDGVYKFIACSMKVTLYEADTVETKEFRNSKTGGIELRRVGKAVRVFGAGTKMVPLTTKYAVDDSALMKAETGAIGRALGMAGMLVIPGTGVATAEDMQEALGEARSAPQPEEAAPPSSAAPRPVNADPAPPDKETLTALRQEAVAIINLLKQEFPDTFKEFAAWAKERGIGEVAKVDDARVLQGMIKKADRELTNERGKAAQAAEAEAAAEEAEPQPE